MDHIFTWEQQSKSENQRPWYRSCSLFKISLSPIILPENKNLEKNFLRQLFHSHRPLKQSKLLCFSFKHDATQVYVSRPNDDGSIDHCIYLRQLLWEDNLIISTESLNQKGSKISCKLCMQIAFDSTNMQLLLESNKANVLGLPSSIYLSGQHET